MISPRRLAAGLVAVAAAAIVVVGVTSCGDSKANRSPSANGTASGGTAVTPSRSFVVYGKPKHSQSVNHADDRERGDKLNSFNADGLPTPPSANSGEKGTRAGDNALVTIVLYADRNLTRAVGTATYSCTYNFDQEATCDGQFQIGTGTIIALGPARLDGSQIVLAVTGGTGRYAGAHGQVTSATAAGTKNTQIFRFELV